MDFHVGTSGFMYKHWWGKFYPEKVSQRQALEYYSTRFNTVEINNTFYNLPRQATFEGWRRRTPEKFILTLKASRFITHVKRLMQPEESVRNFLERSACLKEKRGPILFQLPPGWNADLNRLEQFFKYLRSKEDPQLSISIEYRNNSWITEKMFDVLCRYKVAFCIHDMGGVDCPDRATADFVYYRLHGPSETKYSGRYSVQQIKQIAARMRRHLDGGRSAYCYFNNDIGGHAIENARMLIDELNP